MWNQRGRLELEEKHKGGIQLSAMKSVINIHTMTFYVPVKILKCPLKKDAIMTHHSLVCKHVVIKQSPSIRIPYHSAKTWHP